MIYHILDEHILSLHHRWLYICLVLSTVVEKKLHEYSIFLCIFKDGRQLTYAQGPSH